MKKILALVLAMLLVMSMSVALAAVSGLDQDGNPVTKEDVSTVTLAKLYNLLNPGTENPAETFSFTIENYAVSETDYYASAEDIPAFNPATYTIDFEKGDATLKKSKTIDLPTYEHVGIYTYKVTETAGTMAGVVYDSNPIFLKVTVLQDDDADDKRVRVVALHYENEVGDKLEYFTNEFQASGGEEGGLWVTKVVTGNAGEKERYFPIKVSFAAPKDDEGNDLNVVWADLTVEVPTETGNLPDGTAFENPTEITAAGEYTFYLKDQDTVKIKNIPYGVTYTIAEDTPEINYEEPDISTYDGVINSTEADKITVTNTKDVPIDTGITLETLPYILVLGLALVGAVLMIVRRRRSNEE